MNPNATKLTVPTPGAPVAVATTPTSAARIRVEALSTNTGKLYLGTRSLDVSIGAGVITVLNAGQAFDLASFSDSDVHHAELYILDTDTAGSAAYVTLWAA